MEQKGLITICRLPWLPQLCLLSFWNLLKVLFFFEVEKHMPMGGRLSCLLKNNLFPVMSLCCHLSKESQGRFSPISGGLKRGHQWWWVMDQSLVILMDDSSWSYLGGRQRWGGREWGRKEKSSLCLHLHFCAWPLNCFITVSDQKGASFSITFPVPILHLLITGKNVTFFPPYIGLIAQALMSSWNLWPAAFAGQHWFSGFSPVPCVPLCLEMQIHLKEKVLTGM